LGLKIRTSLGEKKSWLGNVSLVHLTRDDAEDAIDSMDGRTFEGRELRVQLAK
jgi:hypothetical protein